MKSRLDQKDAIEADKSPHKGATLLDETRTYVVDEAELAEWLSGSTLFHVFEITNDLTFGVHRFKVRLTTIAPTTADIIVSGRPTVRASQGTLFVPETQTQVPPAETGPQITDLEGDEGVDDVPSQITERTAGRKRTMRPVA